jgi:hypothetical protein
MLVWLKTTAVIHRCYQRFREPPSFEGGSQPSLLLRTVAGTGLLAHTVVHSIGLSSRIADRSVRQKASGHVIPTRCYREVFVTFSLAGSGVRGAATLRCALNDPSTCCTDGSRFGSILASIARPSKHGSHHVCDNRAPQRTSSKRMALTDS